MCDVFNRSILPLGKAWHWNKDKCWWHGDPWDQVWRFHLLRSACGFWVVAHLPSNWCQIYTHGRSSAKGKSVILTCKFEENVDLTHFMHCSDYPLKMLKNVKVFSCALTYWKTQEEMITNYMFPGHFAQWRSHGWWADVVSFSEGRISQCQTHPDCYSPFYSLHQVLDI